MLNKVTIKNRYPLPSIDNLFDQLKDYVIFSKIDMRPRYHQLRIKELDTHMIAFKIINRYYEFVVSPFRLINSLVAFMNLMNNVY